ncbi:hypothetical protein M8818_000812 [Zalaria obscura]|uniref:Uncharacterized protein n=1 Tax=Zalaria obscura TaxID=2024903 RepID=A0ACC3SN93_9PEZI
MQLRFQRHCTRACRGQSSSTVSADHASPAALAKRGGDDVTKGEDRNVRPGETSTILQRQDKTRSFVLRLGGPTPRRIPTGLAGIVKPGPRTDTYSAHMHFRDYICGTADPLNYPLYNIIGKVSTGRAPHQA